MLSKGDHKEDLQNKKIDEFEEDNALEDEFEEDNALEDDFGLDGEVEDGDVSQEKSN